MTQQEKGHGMEKTRCMGHDEGNCIETEWSGWRKSRYSAPLGECVEAASWRKSTWSQNNGACIEAGTGTGTVGVRDTKDSGCGPVLEFTPAAWQLFLSGLK